METTSKNQIKLGIFLAVALFITLLSIFVLGGDSFFKKHILLHVHFDQVQGLAPMSMVSLSGIRIGNVEEIQFLPDENKLDVILNIKAEFQSRIKEDSKVEIKTQGALGDKYVYITSGDPSKKTVEAGATLDAAPSTDMMSVLSQRGGETEKIFDIISEIHKMVKAINQNGKIEQIMSDLSETSASMKVTAAESKSLIKELNGENPAKIRQAVTRLNSILEKIDNGEGSLGALINDPSLHQQLKSMLGGNDRKKVIKTLIQTSIDKNPKN